MARNYMMRSEKRGSTVPSPPVKEAHRKGRPRRKGAGFVYKFFMMLLLLLLWPFGLLMLWHRKVDWSGAIKLLVSIVTLAACILIFGFALTVNTGNEQYTRIQDAVNSGLDAAANWLVDAGQTVGEKSAVVWDGVTNLADAARKKTIEALPDALDQGVEIAGQVKATFVRLANKVGWELTLPDVSAGDETPAVTAVPRSELPDNAGAWEKAENVAVNMGDETLPIYVPDSHPDASAGTPVTEDGLTRGVPTPTPKPTPAPTSTPEPAETESAEAE